MDIIQAVKEGKSLLEIQKLNFSDKEIQIIDEEGRSVLHFAAIKGRSDLIEFLVKEKGLDIDTIGSGCTALFEACDNRNWDHNVTLKYFVRY